MAKNHGDTGNLPILICEIPYQMSHLYNAINASQYNIPFHQNITKYCPWDIAAQILSKFANHNLNSQL
jgi:hypothetical protein